MPPAKDGGMEISMKKIRTAILRFNLALILMYCLLCTLILPAISEAKKADPNEGIYENEEQEEVQRKKYDLVARDVAEVQVGTDLDFWEVYIRQRNEKTVREIDFFRIDNEKISYKTNIVSNNAKKFYPHEEGSILVDKNNRVLFTGTTTCHYFVFHKSENQCEKANRPKQPYVNKVVERNVGKTWGNNSMFAYIKNNNLYITGEVISDIFGDDNKCYGQNSVRTYFKGRGSQIKQVVCGNNTIFVLMKDGSVWGIGENDARLISQSKQKNYREFTKIIDGGVKQITASMENVAVIKKDQTLWIWGRSLYSSKKGYITTPKKIANNVVEASLSSARRGGALHSMLVYLKENYKAYGVGYNQSNAFGNQYKNRWHNKPVLLMKNVRHVYAVQNATLLLNRKHELYWSGKQKWYGGYGELKKN